MKCIAVDDEPLALRKIVDFIKKVPFLEYKASFDNGLEALAYLKKEPVDILFLDIQMPQIKGTQLVNILKNKPQIIFTTAYSEYAIEGYELDVTDYLLKPISFDRFLEAAQKAIDRSVPVISQSGNNEMINKTEFIFIKTEYKWQKVRVDSIRYIEGLKDYLSIYTATERILTLQSFSSLLEKLPETDFIRIHKSYVISIPQIDEIEKKRVLIGDNWIPVSDTYRQSFFNLLETRGMI
ncbi:MAG: LytTR family DNA-binding domain-containing protein [Cyclobacteriaceae bacterium]